MAKITSLSLLPILFKSRNGASSTIEPGVTLTLPDYEVTYDQVDSGIERGWLSVTKDDGSALFDSFGKVVGANPVPVSLSSGDVTITGPVTVATEVEIKNDTGNPIPVTGVLTESQLGTKATAVTALGAGGTGIIGWLSQIWQALTGTLTVAVAPAAAWQEVAIMRPANVTAYAAGDVIGGPVTFPAMGAAGSQLMLTSVNLRIDISAIPSGMTGFKLLLFRATPPSALADNAAWDFPIGDRASFIGSIDLSSPTDFGSTLFSQLDSVNKHAKLGASETALYGYLMTTGAFTPAANSEVYTLTLRAVAL